MKRVLTLAGSSSKQSINRALAQYTTSLLENVEAIEIDLNDYEMPLYSIDKENEGIPELAQAFHEKVTSADAIVLSLAEHNGAYSAAFKNLLDWASRIDKKVWQDKSMFLMSTSPGPRGAATVMGIAQVSFPHVGGNIKASFSLPSFQQNFDPEKGITDPELKKGFKEAFNTFKASF